MEPLRIRPAGPRTSANYAAALLLALFAMLPSAAVAHGALAIGISQNGAIDGVAFGVAWNYGTAEAASAIALKGCQTHQNASEATRKLCKVVKIFARQCVAVAMEPQDGAPGFGWAVTSSQSSADSTALQNCRTAAGLTGQESCKIIVTRCDGR